MTTDHKQQARELLAEVCNCLPEEIHDNDLIRGRSALLAIEAALAQSGQQDDDLTVAYMAGKYDGRAAQQAGAVPEGWVLVLDGLSDALRMHREARTTYKSLESSVDDAIRSLRAMLAAAPPAPSGGRQG